MKKLLQWYLKFWASRYLKKQKPRIIAVTGSVGKTSTKEAIFEVLKIKFGSRVRKSFGNLNNETGVPLAILGFKRSPQRFWHWFPIVLTAPFKSFSSNIEVLVLELAADKPGDIRYLTSFVKPHVAVLTSIGPAHLEAFGSIQKIVEEKTDLLRVLSIDDWAVLGIDDQNLRKASFDGRWQTITYATGQKADITAKNITTDVEAFLPKTKFQLVFDGQKRKVVLKSLGTISNILAALAATACGKIFDLSIDEIVKGLENIYTEKHRMDIIKGKKNTIIIDDSYNANPMSMKAALDVFKVLAKPINARKIAVLGDMLEIGEISTKSHNELGKYARSVADMVISVGEHSKKFRADKHFSTAEEAAKYLLKEIEENDIILIKASRALAFENIVEMLRANPKH